MRDRLIELLKLPSNCMPHARCESCGLNGGCSVQRQADKLIANGVIVPPCKVGQTVYAKKGCFYLPHATRIKFEDIIACEIIAIKETKKGKFILLKPLIEEAFNMRSANGWFSFLSIGKTVFLTKEEAEQALRKEDEGK